MPIPRVALLEIKAIKQSISNLFVFFKPIIGTLELTSIYSRSTQVIMPIPRISLLEIKTIKQITSTFTVNFKPLLSLQELSSIKNIVSITIPAILKCFPLEITREIITKSVVEAKRKSLISIMKVQETSTKITGKKLEKGKKGVLRSGKVERKPKSLISYSTLNKPLVEFYFNSFAENSKSHIRILLYTFKQRLRNLLQTWKNIASNPSKIEIQRPKSLIDLLILSSEKTSKKPIIKNHYNVSIHKPIPSYITHKPILKKNLPPIRIFTYSVSLKKCENIEEIYDEISQPLSFEVDVFKQPNIDYAEINEIDVIQLPEISISYEMNSYKLLSKPVLCVYTIVNGHNSLLKESLRNLSHVIKQKMAKVFNKWYGRLGAIKHIYRLLYKPIIRLEEYSSIEIHYFKPFVKNNISACKILPLPSFSSHQVLSKRTYPVQVFSQLLSQENIKKTQALIRGFILRRRMRLVYKLKGAIFPLTFLFKYLSEKISIRPSWNALQSNIAKRRTSSPLTRKSLFNSLYDGSQRSPSPSRTSSPKLRKPIKSTKSRSKKIRMRKLKEAYAMNLQVLVPLLSKFVKKQEKIGISRMQSLLPKYLRKRFYNIQKGMKAIIHVCITNPETFAIEIMKYALYTKTYANEHNLLSFTPAFIEFLPKIIQIQKFVRGHLARKRTNTLKEEKVHKKKKSLSKFVIKSRTLELKKVLGKILNRITKDIVIVLQKNAGKIKKNVYGMQKASKKITVIIQSRLLFGLNSLKSNN